MKIVWRPSLLLGLGLVAIALANTALARESITFDVDTVEDLVDDNTGDGLCHTSANNCSLRAAIMQSNHLPDSPIVLIRIPAGVYLITRPIAQNGDNGEDLGDLDLTPPPGPTQTLILGAGAAQTIIDGNHLDAVFYIQRQRVVSIDGLTVRNGLSSSSGGGLFVDGSLTLTNSIIEDNSARLAGGAICMGISNGSTLNVIRSTLRSNRADYGGGIAVFNNVNVRNSTLERNTATSSGGGFYNNGQLIIVNSTISGNSTNTDGGGIYNRNSAFLYSTSVINNDADHDRDELGGIGGGVYAFATSRFVAVNTLFSGNTILDSPTPDNCNGVLEIYGMNLFDAIDGCTFSGNGGAAWDFVAGNSIGALQDNGGPTLTHALLPGSEAIDTPNIQICIDENGFPLTTDQRGAVRITGLRCDVGALEYGSIADRIFQDDFD